MTKYTKLDINEDIQVGDLISLIAIPNKVTRSVDNKFLNKDNIVGICMQINSDNTILVADKGIVTVNVQGIICIGDKLKVSNIPGKAKAIKYDQDELQFNIRSIGKVIKLYNDYSKADILLGIE